MTTKEIIQSAFLDNEHPGKQLNCTTAKGKILLSDVTHRIAKTLNTENITLTTGLGISDNINIPFRAPVIMIPSLQIMENFLALGIKPPKYILYQALHFIIETNGLNEERTILANMRLERYLKLYIEKFHPDLVEFIQFEFQDNNLNNTESTDYIKDVLYGLISEGNPIVINTMEKLGQYRKYNNKPDGSEYTYAAANIFLNGAFIEKYPYIKTISEEHVILPIGGIKEQPFFELTELVFEKMQQNKRNKQGIITLLQSIGSQPPYYHHKDGEPQSIKDFDTLNKFHSHIKKDVNLIKLDTNNMLNTLLTLHSLVHKDNV